MKRFTFTLAAALSWREHLCKKEKAVLETERGAEAMLDQQLDKVLQELRSGIHEGAIDAAELHRIAAYRNCLRNSAARLESELSIRRTRVEQQRVRCVEAERQRMILEKLKQARLAEWKRDVDRELETQSAEFFSHKLFQSR